MAHIFISYSKQDITFARHLRQLLQDSGFAVWMDEKNLEASERWWPTIERNIIISRTFIVIMSPYSKDSDWVEREILVAEDKRKPIFPILLEGERWSRLANIQYQDMTTGLEAVLDPDFVASLEKYVAINTGATPPPLPAPPIDTSPTKLPAQPPKREIPTRNLVLALGAVGVVIVISLFVWNRLNNGAPTTPTTFPTNSVTVPAVVQQPSDTPSPTITLTASNTPTKTPTLSQTEAELTVQAEMKLAQLENAQSATSAMITQEAVETLSFGTTADLLTAIATRWTYTPTPDVRQTALARLALTQSIIDLTSTAGAWTKTLTNTPTFTPSWTPTATFTHTFIPTYTSTATATPSSSPTPDPFRKITRNADWQEQIVTTAGVDMVVVPTGCFMMGSEDNNPNEKPAHVVCITHPFYLDRFEVTNAQFASKSGTALHQSNQTGIWRPRENITWDEAKNYCEKRGARLPTEAEWEYAARGPDDLIYPWGNNPVPENVVYGGDSASTADVGEDKRPNGKSWVGSYDMLGNVWEWTADWYSDYTVGNQPDPTGPSNGTYRVVRGNSWLSQNATEMYGSYRYYGIPGGAYIYGGIRCARSY